MPPRCRRRSRRRDMQPSTPATTGVVTGEKPTPQILVLRFFPACETITLVAAQQCLHKLPPAASRPSSALPSPSRESSAPPVRTRGSSFLTRELSKTEQSPPSDAVGDRDWSCCHDHAVGSATTLLRLKPNSLPMMSSEIACAHPFGPLDYLFFGSLFLGLYCWVLFLWFFTQVSNEDKTRNGGVYDGFVRVG
ncbi:hypothetical protein DEO72_LG7g1576 [Vigna unguiculata]|uniref:Uncharacterized protein n=1 Tax=Vigna unguiculata TaxID=3917 RepID=A0A4D6MFZ0_VIGUN|nr:hypothetical protein DEO72_LG7g1576 [Vigna unguiculata]